MRRTMASQSWVVTLAIVGLVCTGGVLLAPVSADAFTLIEHFVTIPVELFAGQTAHLEYRNLSGRSVDVTLAFLDWSDASRPVVVGPRFIGTVTHGLGRAIDIFLAPGSAPLTIVAALVLNDPGLKDPAFMPVASLQIMEGGRTILLPAVQRVRTGIP